MWKSDFPGPGVRTPECQVCHTLYGGEPHTLYGVGGVAHTLYEGGCLTLYERVEGCHTLYGVGGGCHTLYEGSPGARGRQYKS